MCLCIFRPPMYLQVIALLDWMLAHAGRHRLWSGELVASGGGVR